MDSSELIAFDQYLRPMESRAPLGDGFLTAEQMPDNSKGLIICGNRVGLIRLAIMILRYAINARPSEGKFKADAKVIRECFGPSSRIDEVFLQLDETPPHQQPKKKNSWPF